MQADRQGCLPGDEDVPFALSLLTLLMLQAISVKCRCVNAGTGLQ
jgi:hypothetical protein